MARQPTELQRENGFFTVSPMNFLETARTEVSAKMADEFSNEQEKILGDESIKKLDKKKLQKGFESMEKELQDEVLKGLDIFESYALTNVFKIPDNAVLSQPPKPSKLLPSSENIPSNAQLDNRLTELRERIVKLNQLNKTIKAEIRVLNTENKQLEQCLNTKDVLDINQQSHNDDMNENITKFVADFEKMHDQVNEVDQELKQHPGAHFPVAQFEQHKSNTNVQL
jgi:predicted RNase H-like nuclease (RuvC/YqgF family)